MTNTLILLKVDQLLTFCDQQQHKEAQLKPQLIWKFCRVREVLKIVPMLLKMKFKDDFLCLRKKEHTWQPANNQPVVSDFFQKNEMPPKWACFPFSISSNHRHMTLNVHSPHTGLEEVSICQNCGLKMKAKCRWKWLWGAGPNSLSRDYWGGNLAGWRFHAVTGAGRCRAGDGIPWEGPFPTLYKSVLRHVYLKEATAA